MRTDTGVAGPARRFKSRRPFLLLALGFATLFIIALASVWIAQRAETASRQVGHSLEVNNKLANFLLVMREAESGQRGFLLTNGDPQYLADYRTAASRALSSLAEIKVATADNPVQQAAVLAIKSTVREKLSELAQTIKLFQAGDAPAAMALVRSDTGRDFMESLRAVVQGMTAEEARLLQLRQVEFNRTNSRLLFVAFLGALVALGLAGVVMLLARRATRALQSAYAALEAANSGLEARVAERTADLREANDEIQRFAYIVGHDLRAPLVNIMGFTSELETLRRDLFERLAGLRASAGGAPEQDKPLSEAFSEAFGFIKAAIGKMDRLINAILKLSREGRREFRPERVDMSALLEGIAASLAHQASSIGASITIDPLPPATSDRLALEQVFSNLLDNALKYLRAEEPGRIQVTGKTTPTAQIYEVRDNGRGIDPRDRERVFELFRRAGPQDRPGEGIGLAHTRALVRRLGGSITLSSEPGRGTVFTVMLPDKYIDEQGGKAA